MMFKCPSDCEHPYLFQHSIITSDRIEKESDGTRVRVRSVTVICRECGCWTSRKNCGCRYECHKEDAVEVTRTALDVVS